MFTGIIETLGTIQSLAHDKSNLHITIESSISPELKVDQSIAHDGVCLTVVDVNESRHTVTAVKETLDRSNLSDWKIGDNINLERCMIMNGRLDGHIVQGHVDSTATCVKRIEQDGSWEFRFSYPDEHDGLVISKGSISINGTSLTVVNPSPGEFSVAIIPYTYDNTKFKDIQVGDKVNLEFDILGKYIQKNISLLR